MVFDFLPQVLQIEAIQFPLAHVKGPSLGARLAEAMRGKSFQTVALGGTGLLDVEESSNQAFQDIVWPRKREVKDWAENACLLKRD